MNETLPIGLTDAEKQRILQSNLENTMRQLEDMKRQRDEARRQVGQLINAHQAFVESIF